MLMHDRLKISKDKTFESYFSIFSKINPLTRFNKIIRIVLIVMQFEVANDKFRLFQKFV